MRPPNITIAISFWFSRKPKYTPQRIPKPSFQKLFKKTNKINSYMSFEDWLAQLTGD